MARPATHARFRRPLAIVVAFAVAVLLALALSPSARATLPVGDQFRISQMGADGDPEVDAMRADAAYNPRTDRYLVVWEGESVDGEWDIWGALRAADGTPVGGQFRISDMGPNGSTAYEGRRPKVAYNIRADEYLVVWDGDDDTAPLVNNENEVFGQLLSAAGNEIGPNDFRISDMGADTVVTFRAASADVAFNAVSNEYLVVWDGNDGTPPMANNETEIFGQRLSPAGAEVGVNDFRVSDMGTDGDLVNLTAGRHPTVAVNSDTGEYLVAWSGDDGTGLPQNEFEVYAQRLSAAGAEVGTNDVRVSDVGPAGSGVWGAFNPDVVYNARAAEFMVVFWGDDDVAPLVENEMEVFAQRLTAAGGEVGGNDVRISDMGVDGDATWVAFVPRVAYDVRANEYLVTWYGDDGTAPLAGGQYEVFGQRLDGAGAETGTNDFRISAMGPDASTDYWGQYPVPAYNSRDNEYLVVWEGDSDALPLVDEEYEIWGRRTGAGAILPPPAPVCANVVPPTPPPGDPSRVTLSVTQLLINQRISQAAVRRVNAVQEWLDAGVRALDLCGGALAEGDFGSGVVVGHVAPPATLPLPSPRPVTPLPIGGGDPSKVTLTRTQLLINQRISQAAVRRANALAERLAAGLTGGDVVDGQIPIERIQAGLAILAATPIQNPPAASQTIVAPPTRGDPSKVALTRTQLLINQRISQAAVKRSNVLRARLLSGLTGAEFADGTVTAVDLAAGIVP